MSFILEEIVFILLLPVVSHPGSAPLQPSSFVERVAFARLFSNPPTLRGRSRVSRPQPTTEAKSEPPLLFHRPSGMGFQFKYSVLISIQLVLLALTTWRPRLPKYSPPFLFSYLVAEKWAFIGNHLTPTKFLISPIYTCDTPNNSLTIALGEFSYMTFQLLNGEHQLLSFPSPMQGRYVTTFQHASLKTSLPFQIQAPKPQSKYQAS